MLFVSKTPPKQEARPEIKPEAKPDEKNSAPRKTRLSMRTRLYLTMFLPLLAVFGAVFAVLYFTGIISSGAQQVEESLAKDLGALSNSVEKSFGAASNQAAALSRELGTSIAAYLSRKGKSFSDLDNNPALLEELMDEEISRLLLALEKTNFTGVFLCIDATVNTSVPNAKYSKAGLYIRIAEPKVASLPASLLYLRGFPSIRDRNNLYSQSRWRLEYQTAAMDFYNVPIDAHLSRPGLPLSRLYYWTFQSAIPDLDEKAALCSIPVLSPDGGVWGVCGFEISGMNFKQNYAPDLQSLKRAAVIFSKTGNGEVEAENALLSGNGTVLSRLAVKPFRDGLSLYEPRGSGAPLAGVQRPLKLYYQDSPFTDVFSLSVLVPKSDVDDYILLGRLRLAGLGLLFLGAAVLLSLFISRLYVRSITRRIESAGTGETGIAEIDRIIKRINALNPKKTAAVPMDLVKDFLKGARSLTPQERSILALYADGFSNEEILREKGISVNTFKVHNSHIYGKLGVTSREELLLYIEFLRKSHSPELSKMIR